MTANSSPAKRHVGSGSTSDIDTIVPLLFAAHPSLMPNYKKMSALDDHGRTAAALEHKFRKWRHISRDILAAHPEEAGTDQAVGQPAQPKKSRSPKKQISGPNNNNDDSEDEASKPKSSTKKRAAPSDANEGAPSKKPKGQKKGNAQKARSMLEASEKKSGEVTVKKEEEDMSGEDGVEMEFEENI